MPEMTGYDLLKRVKVHDLLSLTIFIAILFVHIVFSSLWLDHGKRNVRFLFLYALGLKSIESSG